MPGGARAAASSYVEPLYFGEGNQTAPSLRLPRVAYLDDASGTPQVILKQFAGGDLLWSTTGTLFPEWPRVGPSALAYRIQDYVQVLNLADVALEGAAAKPRDVPAPGRGRVALGSSFVAWEQPDANGGPDATDVAWCKVIRGVADRETTKVLGKAGRQGWVAAVNDWLAWVDYVDGRVHLLNTASGVATDFLPIGVGVATEVALDAENAGGQPRVAVAAAGDGGTRISVLDASGQPERTLLSDGEKVNVHLYGEWIGYEDLSLTVPQVVLWHWAYPDEVRRYLPAVDATLKVAEQRLHDLSTVDDQIDVVWAQATDAGDFDIYRYHSALPIEAIWLPSTESAVCGVGDPAITVEAVRVGGKPAAYGWQFDPGTTARILVCMDATDVTAGWVAVGERVVAAPGDFGRGWVHREARLTVEAGQRTIGAVLAGKPGSSMRLTVYVDGGGKSDVPVEEATCDATGTCPPGPPGLAPEPSSGCATGGGAGLLALLLAPAALLLVPRRRARR